MRQPLPWLLCLTALLSACTSLSPAPATPTTHLKIPAAWSSTQHLARTGNNVGPWWEQWQDPLLLQLLQTAQSRALDVQLAQDRLAQARANVALTQASDSPTLSATLSQQHSFNRDSAPKRLLNAGLAASWEPALFGAQHWNQVAAQADAQTSTAQLESARVAVAVEVARAYINSRSLQQRLALAQHNVQEQNQSLQLTQQRQLAGLVSMLELEQARSSLAQAQASVPALASQLAAQEHRLDILLGQAPGQVHALLQPTTTTTPSALPQPAARFRLAIPAETLRQRPDVRAAEWALQAEIARTSQRQRERYPNFNLSGVWNWQSLNFGAADASSTLARSITASLVATLFDGDRLRQRVVWQNAVQDQAQHQYEKTVLAALEEVENALANLSASDQRLQSQREATQASARSHQLLTWQHQAGLVDFQRQLDSQNNLRHAEDALASAEAEQLLALIQLYQTLGGGWPTPIATEPATP